MPTMVETLKKLNLKARLHINIPAYIHVAIREEAAYQQRTVTNLIAHIIVEYMRARPKERWTHTEKSLWDREDTMA